MKWGFFMDMLYTRFFCVCVCVCSAAKDISSHRKAHINERRRVGRCGERETETERELQNMHEGERERYTTTTVYI